MAPFLGKPVLAHILNLLKEHHIYEVVLTVRYLADQIQDYFGDGSQLGMQISYALEETPLGTAGSVKNAQPHLDGSKTILVMSGDIITDIDLTSLILFHRQRRALTTLALKQVPNPRQYGLVATDRSGRICRYVEKPTDSEARAGVVNTGIYVLETKMLEMLEPGIAYDFSYDLFPRLVSQHARLYGWISDSYWCDIGTLQSYMKATADALTGKIGHINQPQPSLAPQLAGLGPE
jgi:mannose-1-phosphate guanylyltransferase/phosphomannomutase